MSFYGELPLVEFEVGDLLAAPLGYNSIVVSWTPPLPTDPWDRIVLLRSAFGHPETLDDGVIIFDDVNPSSTEAITDTPLTGGSFYYYTLLMHHTTEVIGWVEVGRAMALATKDWDTKHQMWNVLTPATYHSSDGALGTWSIGQGGYTGTGMGPHERIIDLFARQLDHIRTEFETLRWIHDINRISANLLPLAATDLGAEVEPEIGDILSRKFVRNLPWIYKRKGTAAGVSRAVSSLTGWMTNVVYDDATDEAVLSFHADRINLIRNPSFEVDVTRWTLDGVTAAQSAAQALSGTSSALLTATATGTADRLFRSERFDAVAEESFSGGFGVRAVTGPQAVRADLEWFDSGGLSLGVEAGVEVIADETEWTRVEVGGTAPADTDGVEIILVFPVMDDGIEMHTDAVILERGLLFGTYFDASLLTEDGFWAAGAHDSESFMFRRRIMKMFRLDEIIIDFLPIDMGHRLEFVTTV